MGDYAASGGYYISCVADRIFAERTTITGSIGIFGLIPCYENLIENKLGVHMAAVKTNENADFGVVGKKFTPVQMAALQNMINAGYDLFTKRCADGRHVTQDSIKKIAEGRVWDGLTAKQIGLVDEFGGIREAVAWVAKKATRLRTIRHSKTSSCRCSTNTWWAAMSHVCKARWVCSMTGTSSCRLSWAATTSCASCPWMKSASNPDLITDC